MNQIKPIKNQIIVFQVRSQSNQFLFVFQGYFVFYLHNRTPASCSYMIFNFHIFYLQIFKPIHPVKSFHMNIQPQLYVIYMRMIFYNWIKCQSITITSQMLITKNAIYIKITSFQKLTQSSMDQQLRTRDSQRSLTADEQDQMNWSQSSQTYYYSKFELFERNEEINQFYRYSVFLSKVSEELGQQWKSQAHVLFQPYFNSQDVFMNLLSIWLQLHPMINTVHQNPLSSSKISPPVFNNNFIEQFVSRMKSIHAESQRINSSDLKVNATFTKSICMGFFITANQIWTQMFRNEQKSTNKGFSLFKGVTKKIQQSFQPLMVVTQKISNLFGRKKVKIDESINQSMANDAMFGDCFYEFRRTIGLQKELQRKMSQFCLEQEPAQNIKQQKKIVTKDQFKLQQSPMEKNVLGNIYSYITRFLNRKYPWQVASSFVTNILDINEQNMQDGTKIKVLKPAQDFYQKLILGWLMLRKCKEPKAQISFQEYVCHIKISFGRAWRQKYIIPTKYFYERLIKHQTDIQKQTQIIKLTEKQILNSLINKIRESMREDWQRKIKIQKKKSNGIK